jgi:hypothetical protein
MQACGVCAALMHGAARAQLADDPETPVTIEVQPRVTRAFDQQDRVRVFLILRAPAKIAAAQDALLSSLGSEFELGRRYHNIPVVAGTLSRAGLARVVANAAVASVQLDGTGSGGLAEAVPAARVDLVHSMRGLTGKDITVAVIDTGTTTTHPALKDAIIGQHCFTQFDCGFSNEGDSAEDDHNHGSNVTGIVASRGGGGVSVGYAPGANIVAVKVLNGSNAGQVSDWVAGFDWLLTNQSKFDLKVINASLVSTAEYASAAECDAGETALAMVTSKLIAAGVTITGASGNTGHTTSMTAPACNTGVIAVGATYDSDLGAQPESGGTYQGLGGSPWPACSDATTSATTIACFTCAAGKRLDLLAPGSQIISTGIGTGKSMFRGTSQAAPGVAGLAALMLECNPMLAPSEILAVLKKTGMPITDSRTGMSYPLIRGLEAVDMACPIGANGSGGSSGAGDSGASGAAGSGGSGSMSGTGGANAGSGGADAGMMPVPTGTGGASGSGGMSGVAMPPVMPNAGSGGATTGAGIAGTPVQSGTGGGAALVGTSGTSGSASADAGCSVMALGARTRASSAWAWLVCIVLAVRIRRARTHGECKRTLSRAMFSGVRGR